MNNREAHFYLEELQRMMTQHRDIFTEEFVCANGMAIQALEKAQEQRWIPVSERPPEDLEEVNITFTNLEPEPYYDFIKGKRFTGSAVFYEGEWYWYSSITVDVLKEYGRYESEKIDKGLKIIAWMPLPDPYKEEQE